MDRGGQESLGFQRWSLPKPPLHHGPDGPQAQGHFGKWPTAYQHDLRPMLNRFDALGGGGNESDGARRCIWAPCGRVMGAGERMRQAQSSGKVAPAMTFRPATDGCLIKAEPQEARACFRFFATQVLSADPCLRRSIRRSAARKLRSVRRSELGLRARVARTQGRCGRGASGPAAARPDAVLADADFGDGRARAINVMMIADPACERRFRGRYADSDAWCAKPKAP
jgi:hypothetical protein